MNDFDRPPQTLSVLMPIYNERWTLREIVQRVLRAPLAMEIELVAVNDASQDGSWEVLQQLAAEDARIKAFRHPQNRGKGAAIRTAIQHMTGDVAVVQDADLEYDPHEFPLLLAPILEDKADAVFGSRFAGHSHRVLFFWHMVVNHMLTLVSNMLNDLNLTDMETCYKMVRADILRNLRLSAETFTLEPELTCRLAQWRARIYEVPISYAGRTYDEGKKIRASDGVKAMWQMFYSKLIDPQFTDRLELQMLTSMSRAVRYHRWLLRQVKGFLGHRVLDAGAGIGTLGSLLTNREQLLLVDNEPMYLMALRQRFRLRNNVRVEEADLADPETCVRWRNENLDTILAVHVLEQLAPDARVLGEFYETLAPGGHCIVVASAGPRLYNGADTAVGMQRRYAPQALRQTMRDAGFQVVHEQPFGRLGTIGRALSRPLPHRRRPHPPLTACFGRLWPLTRALDHVLPAPGLSLIMVGRK